MKYMLLIYADEQTAPRPGSPEWDAMLKGYGEFGAEVNAKGVFVAGEPLESATTASTVAVRDGKREVVDGPYAETKEQLGGFYILDCENLDEALAYAAKIPSAHHGHIEVRPVMDLGGHG